MGSFRTHTLGAVLVITGFLATLVFFSVMEITPKNAVVFFSIAVMAALFPDIDTNSKGQTLFYSLFFVLDVYLIALENYEYAALLGLAAMLPILGRHRGWTHTWWAMILVPSPILLLPWLLFEKSPTTLWPYYVSAFLGYFSHLAIDRKL